VIDEEAQEVVVIVTIEELELNLDVTEVIVQTVEVKIAVVTTENFLKEDVVETNLIRNHILKKARKLRAFFNVYKKQHLLKFR